jgi:phosphatidylserine/phosphatidylglycerophosphate/cardiolipin synthase-like enzyme
VALVNGLPRGKAILDSRTPLFGTHHQKVQAVVGSQSGVANVPVAYCGGMDLYQDRIGPGALHDVHSRVQGDGAADLVAAFSERWNDHPLRDGPFTPTLSTAPSRPPATDLVQVCRTYPRFPSGATGAGYRLMLKLLPTLSRVTTARSMASPGDMTVGGHFQPYAFDPTGGGVFQVWRAVRRAIEKAQRYIYVEDQYLVDLWVGQHLARKLAAAGDDFRIVILCLHPDVADIQQIWPRRRELLADLIAVDPGHKRWQVFTKPLTRPKSYVHSKTWIFDDELVITGSTNIDRRGYTYNSEANVVVAGDVTANHHVTSGATTIAQDLRCRLFAKHLGGRPADHLNATRAVGSWWTTTSPDVAVFDPNQLPGAPDRYVDELATAAQRNPAAAIALATLGGRSGAERTFWDYFEDPDVDVPEPR